MPKRYMISDELVLKNMAKTINRFIEYLESRYPIDDKAKELWFNNMYDTTEQLLSWINRTIKFVEEMKQQEGV